MEKEEAKQQTSLLEQMEDLLLQYQQLTEEMLTEMEQNGQSKK